MPVFRFDKAYGIARQVKAFLSPQGGAVRDTAPHSERYEDQGANEKNARQETSEHRQKLKSKKQELRRMRNETRTAKDEAEFIEQRKRKKTIQQEIFALETELRAARRGEEWEAPVTGALPDFVVLGGKKCGTTLFYHLLTQHPLVEPAAKKELHFFDILFDNESVEWYRRCFPAPRWKDGRRTITGEATPEYLSYPPVPERMAKVIPQARLIALLRNPVDRAYSDYQMVARKGRETRSFEEVIESEQAGLHGNSDKALDDHYDSFDHRRFWYLTKSIYVDQLLQWSECFPKEQVLVLKSEDFFEDPAEILRAAYGFLSLPEWELEAAEIISRRRNKGEYKERMDPATRCRLEEYFEPHNKRLYDYLGRDFNW